jgi:hypothetical protein
VHNFTSADLEKYDLVGFIALQLYRTLPTFRRNVSSSSSGSASRLLVVGFIFNLLFKPEVRGETFLRNVGGKPSSVKLSILVYIWLPYYCFRLCRGQLKILCDFRRSIIMQSSRPYIKCQFCHSHITNSYARCVIILITGNEVLE